MTAQLIKVSDGYHLWSKSYDRELKSVFALEDEIARSIAQTLRHKLLRGGVKPSTTSQEAHDLYLKGRYFWEKRNSEALHQAVSYYRQAIDKDPAYALAYVGLADVTVARVDYEGASPAEVLPVAKRAGLRARRHEDASGHKVAERIDDDHVPVAGDGRAQVRNR